VRYGIYSSGSGLIMGIKRERCCWAAIRADDMVLLVGSLAVGPVHGKHIDHILINT
jgi:hypothetical protein